MRAAIYARVSTPRQARESKTDQQVARLERYAEQKGWVLDGGRIYLDEGYSGASLNRPGLDALRDAAAMAELEVVLLTAPDRLARKYVHQMLLLEELQGRGCRVEFAERPMSQDPNDQLLLQIRGAVAEYERTLIAERMRRGRLAKLRSGQLLPWMRVPFGYRTDPERPRDPQGLRVEEYEAAIVRQRFAFYLEQGATLGGVARRLVEAGVLTPTGKRSWSRSTIRGILKNPAYVGNAYGHCTRLVPAKARRSPLEPVGAGLTAKRRPEEEWIGVSVTKIVGQETFDVVQHKLSQNRKFASRNNKSHRYLLRTLVSCGACGRGSNARTSWDGRSYYVCRGHAEIVSEQRCRTRRAPGARLDELVWEDLCEVLTNPEHVEYALQRAHAGEWLPQELKARLESVGKALAHSERQRERLLEAYLGGVLELAEFERKRKELEGRTDALLAQERQLEASARERTELAGIADSIEGFCERVRAGLASATFEQRRRLVELLIDRVIFSDEEVEIRYVVPTSPEGPHQPFCHLRTDYLPLLPLLWRLDGTWERMHSALRKRVRVRLKRDPQPSAAIVDSQSVKTTDVGGEERGYDGAKKVKGRKRHLLVDTQGLVLKVRVHSARVVDREGIKLLLGPSSTDRFPRLAHLWLDAGYTGEDKGADWVQKAVGWTAEIVRHPPKLVPEEVMKRVLC